jgi:hypothetical protein
MRVGVRKASMLLESSRIAAMSTSLVAWPALAHHSHGNYVMSDFTYLQGTVSEVHFINPHSWVYVEVNDDAGQATLWALEATSAIGLARNGIERDDIRVGDLVKVRCHRLKDGSNGCLLGYLTPLHGDAARGTGIEQLWD